MKKIEVELHTPDEKPQKGKKIIYLDKLGGWESGGLLYE